MTLDSLTHLSYPAAGVLPKVSLTAFVNGWLVDTLGPTKVTIISGEGRFFGWFLLKNFGGSRGSKGQGSFTDFLGQIRK